MSTPFLQKIKKFFWFFTKVQLSLTWTQITNIVPHSCTIVSTAPSNSSPPCKLSQYSIPIQQRSVIWAQSILRGIHPQARPVSVKAAIRVSKSRCQRQSQLALGVFGGTGQRLDLYKPINFLQSLCFCFWPCKLSFAGCVPAISLRETEKVWLYL